VLAEVTGVTGGSNPVDNRQPTIGFTYIIALQGTFPDNGGVPGTPNGTSPPDRSSPFLGEIKAVSFNFAPNGYALCQGQLLPISGNTALFGLIGTTYGGDGKTNFALPDLRERIPIGAGQGTGLSNDYDLGAEVGDAFPTAMVDNLPSHTHTLPSGGNTDATGSGTAFDNRQPALALNFLIGSNGEIIIVPWSMEPTGWAHCDGRALDRTTYNYLFGNIGTTYGSTDSSSFNIPDLRGRTVIGDGATIEDWPIGLNYGSDDIIFGIPDIPAHTHTTSSGDTGSTGGSGNSANNYQPSLAVRWLISFFGNFPSPNSGGFSYPYVGEVQIIAGASANGLVEGAWQPLNGALYSISENETLFNLIGTTYGGDGQDTFAVPNMIATVPAGTNGNSFALAETAGQTNFR
jgi:microcystin-dependent protein